MISNSAQAMPLAAVECPRRHGLRPDLRALLAPGRRVRVAARDTLYQEGEAATTAFVIRSGLVKLVRRLGNGRARIVRLYGPGGLLGIGGVVHPAYEHTAVAVEDMEVEPIPTRRLARLRRDHPDLYARLAESWYGDLRDADTWIMEFSTGSIRARVARLVEHLATIRTADEQGEHVRARVSLLTCGEMAAVLGVTPESVSRVLAELKRSGLLESVPDAGHECYECDTPALRAIAQD